MDTDILYEIIEDKLHKKVDNYHIRVYTDSTIVVHLELNGHTLRVEGIFKHVSECVNHILEKYCLEEDND
jgi:hypothetical protein